jgi:hypothetical protein
VNPRQTYVCEGGPLAGKVGGVAPNVTTCYFGPRGAEVVYERSDRTNERGYVIFVHTPEHQS